MTWLSAFFAFMGLPWKLKLPEPPFFTEFNPVDFVKSAEGDCINRALLPAYAKGEGSLNPTRLLVGEAA